MVVVQTGLKLPTNAIAVQLVVIHLVVVITLSLLFLILKPICTSGLKLLNAG